MIFIQGSLHSFQKANLIAHINVGMAKGRDHKIVRSTPLQAYINATVESYHTNLKLLMKALATIFEQL